MLCTSSRAHLRRRHLEDLRQPVTTLRAGRGTSMGRRPTARPGRLSTSTLPLRSRMAPRGATSLTERRRLSLALRHVLLAAEDLQEPETEEDDAEEDESDADDDRHAQARRTAAARSAGRGGPVRMGRSRRPRLSDDAAAAPALPILPRAHGAHLPRAARAAPAGTQARPAECRGSTPGTITRKHDVAERHLTRRAGTASSRRGSWPSRLADEHAEDRARSPTKDRRSRRSGRRGSRAGRR